MQDPKTMNTIALAFLGDAVYEQFIRTHLLKTQAERFGGRADAMHRAAVCYVRASAQAAAIKEMFDGLSEDEQSLVKRARNHKIASKPKNADAAEYKWATAFEALIGYLYLSGQQDRCNEIMEKTL